MKLALSYFLSLLVGLLIFIGLPLLGWGVRDISGFFDNPARTAYVFIIIILQIFTIFYNPQVGRYQDDRKSGVARHKVDLFLIQVFSLAIVFFAPFSDSRSIATMNLGNPGRYLGLILIVPGFLLMQMAEKQLARQFSIEVTIQENHKLIQDGPYRFIRHPRYLGILIFFLGISFTFQSLLAVFLVIALFLVLIWRIYAEEALMREEFGEEWDAYCRKSWRLIPLVY
jgi:protein-S-isoprenylcysteine O-methyltransferase Ste14